MAAGQRAAILDNILTSPLLSREEQRRFFCASLSSRRMRFSLRKPFVLAKQLGVLRRHPGFLGNRPNPLAGRRKPEPQIRRNLTPRQPTGEREANRIPLELGAVYRGHIRSP